MLSGSITLDGMTATMSHIHQGEVGVNGAVIVPLTETTAGAGVWAVPSGTKLTEAQASSFPGSKLVGAGPCLLQLP